MRESAGARKIRAARIVESLYRAYPDSRCALRHSNALELLVATILSAQCTDVRVNLVTAELFKKFRTARDFATADRRELEAIIHSTGFFRNKAKNLIGMGRVLVEKFGGEVPGSMEPLLELPGVARKTANVVLGTWFRKAAGVVVDTHVHRISHRLNLSRQKDPAKVERDLMALVPQKDWIQFAHMVIWHGRKICSARAPKCPECPVARHCPSAGRVSSSFHVERDGGNG
jgi:endonuclease-3